MDEPDDKINMLHKRSSKHRTKTEILRDLKKAGLKQPDIDYIMNGLQEIELMVKEKKHHNRD